MGAGDGVRGMAIARARNITQVVLCDASAEMVRSCKSLAPTEVLHVKAESLPSFPRGFDVVLCLWNVLGHVEGTQNRIRALTKMRQSLTDPRAVLFLDVNNRHNSAAYGALRVGGRRFLDWIWPDERRGDTRFTWKFGQKEIAGSGHLFTYAEMLSLFSAAGLRIREEVFVDYITGAESKRKTDGQMVFMLGKA